MNPSRPGNMIAALALVLFLAGCYDHDEFQAETLVQPDGSLTRTIKLIGESEETVETRYSLPAGEWLSSYAPSEDLKKKQEVQPPLFYKAAATYKPGQTLSDYTYRGETPGHECKNEIRLKTRDLGLVKFFDYEERFKNSTTRKKAMAAAERWFHGESDQVFKRLAQISEGRISPDEAKEKIMPIFNPLFDRMMQGYLSDGFIFFESKLFEEELEPALRDKKVAETVLEFYPAAPGEDSKAWSEKVHEAVKAASADVDELEHPNFTEDFFGVFDPPIGSQYTFKLSLSLPGHIVQTNAATRQGSKLFWEFDSTAILFDPYVLRASSRLIYLKRIGLVIGILLVSLILYLRRKIFFNR